MTRGMRRACTTTTSPLPRRSMAPLLGALLLGACAGRASPAGSGLLMRSFDAAGISRVVLRASGAEQALVEAAPADTAQVTITGRPEGGAAGYHPSDPAWRETPAAEWGLDFVSRRFGPVLVISTRNEIGFIHHRYVLAELRLRLPASVTLVRQVRRLGGEGSPDLSPP